MLKVKKKIHKTNNNNKNDGISKIQEDLKVSIKNLYLRDQKKKGKQFTTMRNLLQKLEKNMQKCNKKIIN